MGLQGGEGSQEGAKTSARQGEPLCQQPGPAAWGAVWSTSTPGLCLRPEHWTENRRVEPTCGCASELGLSPAQAVPRHPLHRLWGPPCWGLGRPGLGRRTCCPQAIHGRPRRGEMQGAHGSHGWPACELARLTSPRGLRPAAGAGGMASEIERHVRPRVSSWPCVGMWLAVGGGELWLGVRARAGW